MAEVNNKKVISKAAVVKTPPEEKKSILSLFIKEDVGTVWDYVLRKRIVPDAIDLFLNSMSLFLTGETIRTSYSSNRTTIRRTSDPTPYDGYYDKRPTSERRGYTADNLRLPDVNEIGLQEEDDAAKVMDYLNEQYDRYGVVRLTDVYDAVDITVDYTSRARKSGWKSLRGFRPYYQGRDGLWYLDLPPYSRLDN